MAKAPAALTAEDIERQRQWSARTLGPGARTNGILAHIRKELDEVAEHPDDITEWADLIILTLDGATRAGHDAAAIIAAYHDKQAVNETRTWPDWRTKAQDEPIEHVRGGA